MRAARVGSVIRGLAAALILAAVIVGLPVLLYRLGGFPLPARLPTVHHVIRLLSHQDNGRLFLGAVRDVSWLAWVAFTLAVLTEAQAALRGRPAPGLRLAGLQGVASRLVAAAAMAFSAPALVGLAAAPASAATTVAQQPHVPAGQTVAVRPGDCLWTIAQRYLGAGRRYPEILRLNLGRQMGDGQVFRDPAVILPGWQLRLPAATDAAAGRRHDADAGSTMQARDASADRHDRARDERDLIADELAGRGARADLIADIHDLVAGERDLVSDQHVTDHSAHAPGDPHFGRKHRAAHASQERWADPGSDGGGDRRAVAMDRSADGSATVSPGPGRTAAARDGAAPRPAARSVAVTADPRAPLPEAALFTIGLLAGGALASLDRLRHRQRQYRRPGRRIALPADEAGWRIERKLRAAAASDPVGRVSGRPTRLAALDQRRLAGLLGSVGGDDASDTDDRWDRAEADDLASRRLSRSSSHQDGSANGVARAESRCPANWRAALRELSEALAADGEPLPPIVGVHLTENAVEVLLSAPAAKPPPPPFLIAPARQAMCWTADLAVGEPPDESGPPSPGELGDLLPGLFTAGGTEAGGYLLLDLEAMRVTGCDGPEDLTDRLLVTAATELAASRWSAWYDLILVGCDELGVLGRTEQCGDVDEALDLLEDRADAVDRRLWDGGPTDVRERRLADPEDEDWGLALLVSRTAPTPAQLSRLLELADGPCGIAALVPGDTQGVDGKLAPALLTLAPDQDRPGEIVATLTMAHLGPHQQITLWPQTMTVAEYEALAGVFGVAAQAADVGQAAAPYDDYGGPPWIRFASAPVAPAAGADQDWDELAGDQQDARGPASEERSSGLHVVRDAADGLAINVLGPVAITGQAEQLQVKQAELVLALALHAPVGLSNSALCSLLGPDADHPRPSDSVRQLITRTRRNLGRAGDGRDRIVHLGSGIYVLHDEARLDWAVFCDLARRGRAARSAQDLRAALRLVRGQPFADCYHWWIDVTLVETIRAEIVDTAEMLADIELAAGDPAAAGRAAKAGLAAESAAEQLWRALMRAENATGNQAGVTAAWTGCLDAIAEIAPGADPHPDTERLFRLLAGDAAPAGLR